jgi:hypothetical protein
MKDEKYRIIHMFHMVWVLQFTLIQINVLKVCCTFICIKDLRQPLTGQAGYCSARSNKYPRTQDSQRNMHLQ